MGYFRWNSKLVSKGQKLSKWFFQVDVSSKKTNERILLYYYETSGWLVFIRFWRKSKTPKRHFEINWPLVMSKKVGDFIKFCSLLRIYELYKTEAAIDMDIAWPIWQFFTKRFGRGKMFFFLATLQIFFYPKTCTRQEFVLTESILWYLSCANLVENENKDHKINFIEMSYWVCNQIHGP